MCDFITVCRRQVYILWLFFFCICRWKRKRSKFTRPSAHTMSVYVCAHVYVCVYVGGWVWIAREKERNRDSRHTRGLFCQFRIVKNSILSQQKPAIIFCVIMRHTVIRFRRTTPLEKIQLLIKYRKSVSPHSITIGAFTWGIL